MVLRTDGSNDFSSHEVGKLATDRLREQPYQAIRALSCEYEQGTLFLRGKLPSFHQKQLAQEAVGGLEGVDQVVNETAVTIS